MYFCSCDLDLDPMTLIYELDLKILKMYPHTKSELYMSRLSKVWAYYRRTDGYESARVYYHATFAGYTSRLTVTRMSDKKLRYTQRKRASNVALLYGVKGISI